MPLFGQRGAEGVKPGLQTPRPVYLPQQLSLARFSRVPSSSQLKLQKGPKTGSEPGPGTWEVRGKPVGCGFIQGGAAGSGIWGGPFSCPEAWSCPGAGSAVGCDPGEMGGPQKGSGSAFSSSSRSRLRWCVVPTKGSLSTPVGPAVLIRALSPSPSPHWTPDGSPTSVAVVSASALPLPAACLLPLNPHHSAMMSFTIFPLASFFPNNVITSPSTSRDLTVSPQHHYASTSTLSSSLPSSLPPHHTPSSPPSLSHHWPLSPAPPTITLSTALVVTPAPPSYPHPTPNHRGISWLTRLRAVFPPCLLPLPHHLPHHLHHQ